MKRTLLIVLAMILAGCGGGGAAPVPAPGTGDLVPDFTLHDLDGTPVSLADSAGQVRIIDFWATWCAPCREEVPMYKELHAEYGDRGVKILSISMDDEDDLDLVREFIAEYGIGYTNMMDNGVVSDAYRAVGLPATYIVDGEGKLVKNFVGVKPKQVLVDLIEGLLAQPAGEAGS